MDMEDVEDDWEVAFRPHLEKAFWTISDACTSKRLCTLDLKRSDA